MAVNKFAIIRYHALDKCFSNFNRQFYIEDLEEIVHEALEDFSKKKKKKKKKEGEEKEKKNVSRKQIYEDIKFMESDAVYSAPIVKHRDGHRVFYRYRTKAFSIVNKGLTEAEIDMIHDTVMFIKQLKSFPNMEWTEELMVKLKNLTTGNGKKPPVIGFQENPYLKGFELFDPLYQAINHKRVLELEYKSFRKPETLCYTFHPYYLKEYNGRWFVLGKSEGYSELSLFAMDRIESIKETTKAYSPTKIDFDEHFDDVIGVSITKDVPLEKIKLLVHRDAWPYMDTKPLHPSQKRIRELDNEDYYGMALEVKINYELKANLLYRGSAIRVLEPGSLVQWMQEETQKMREYYL